MSAHPTLEIRLRPGLAAISGVMSVLHARLVEVEELTYSADDGDALLQVGVVATRDQADRMALQIDRRVDVLTVHVHVPMQMRTSCG